MKRYLCDKILPKPICFKIANEVKCSDLINLSLADKKCASMIKNDEYWKSRIAHIYGFDVLNYYNDAMFESYKDYFIYLSLKKARLFVIPEEICNFGEDVKDFEITIMGQQKGLKYIKNDLKQRVYRGDVVHFECLGDYRNQGRYIFNGTKLGQLDRLDYCVDDYGAIPKEFYVLSPNMGKIYPVDYWFNDDKVPTIEHNSIVWIKSSDLKFTQIEHPKQNGTFAFFTIDNIKYNIICNSAKIHNIRNVLKQKYIALEFNIYENYENNDDNDDNTVQIYLFL